MRLVPGPSQGIATMGEWFGSTMYWVIVGALVVLVVVLLIIKKRQSS